MSNIVIVEVDNHLDESTVVNLSNMYFDGAIAKDPHLVLSIGEVEALVNTNDLLAAINAVNAAKGSRDDYEGF